MATKLRPWADTGTKIKPADAKIDAGWVPGEQPPAEWENERMNTRDETVNTVIDEVDQLVLDLTDLETRLADDTTPVDGASMVGVYDVAGTPDSITAGNLRQVLLSILTKINARARKASDEDISGDWGFTGRPSIMAGEIGLKDDHHIGKRACIQSYSNTDDKQGIVHPFNEQGLYDIGLQHTDPCAIVDPNKPGNYLAVLTEASGSSFYVVDIVKKTFDGRAISGLAAGVTEITSSCSDGENLYLLVRRAAGDDTVAKVTVSTGAVAWEQTLATANALRGYPYDRIIAGDIISESPWVVDLYVLCGGMTLQTSGVLRKLRSDTGATLWSADEATQTTKQPTGGLTHDGDFVFCTTGIEDGNVPRIVKFGTGTGATAEIIDMSTAAASLSDCAYDLVFDGRRVVWVSVSGYYRYYQPVKTDRWPAETKNNSTTTLTEGFSLVFDGVNIWAVNPDSDFFRMGVSRIHAAGSPGDFKKYPSVIYTNTAWKPQESPWEMGRGCRVGPHVIFSCPVPGDVTSRSAIMTIFNSSTWT